MDTDYWRGVQLQLELARARCIVHNVYDQVLARLASLASVEIAAGSADKGCLPPQDQIARGAARTASIRPVSVDTETAYTIEAGRYSPTLTLDDDDVPPSLQQATHTTSGRFSPLPLQADELTAGSIVSAAADRQSVVEERARIRQRICAKSSRDSATTPTSAKEADASDPATSDHAAEIGQDFVAAEASKGMERGEARFSVEVPLEQKVTWWHDKYRPRKPKYFNRVHTGYEWNKYNQTHYDHDNPPPKMVQGYKFAIFYPDLIDRTQAPTYSLLPDPSGATDTCILRFRGGAPYEDVAFKIVNNEWEHSHKRGFKCKFERGILQLHFNFKRHRYRR